jgi:hypothetical protein
MTIFLITAAWFVCGIGGVHLIAALNEVDPEIGYERWNIWLSMVGPVLLFPALIWAIEGATEKRG